MVLPSDEGLTLELGILTAQPSRYITQKNRDKAQATKSTQSLKGFTEAQRNHKYVAMEQSKQNRKVRAVQ